MSPQLQQVLQDLNQLTSIERWQVFEHLMQQFKRFLVGDADSPQSLSPNVVPQPLNAQAIVEATDGCWGTQSLDEIDAELERQRSFDWGEAS